MRYRTLTIVVSTVAAAVVFAAWGVAEEQLPENADRAIEKLPPTDARHYSYAIGLDIGSSFRADEIKLDVESLLAGVRDGLNESPPKYSRELCGIAIGRLSQKQMEVLRQRNESFLAQNLMADGVEVTDSGLQYQVLKRGDGQSPGLRDAVRVHYQGQFIDGAVFDATTGGPPAELRVDRVVPGWTEALQKMRVGGKWRLFIPSKLAYGESGREGIPPHSALIFELELLDIVKD